MIVYFTRCSLCLMWLRIGLYLEYEQRYSENGMPLPDSVTEIPYDSRPIK